MKIIYEYPPNIEKIREHFPIKSGIIFTYGGELYNPDKGNISADLMAHEETHVAQQGNDPDKWWDRYFIDDAFRLEQETEAYRNQYKYSLENYNRAGRKRLLKKISKDLSSPLYGNLITENEAKEAIIN